MKIVLLLLMTLLSEIASAQYNDSNPYFQRSNGETVYMLGKSVNVYEYPDFNSSRIHSYNEGDSTFLIEIEEVTALVNGISAPFCEVRVQVGQVAEKGFIWSGDIAFVGENRTKNQEQLFLFGFSKAIKSKEKNKEDEYYITCKIFKGKELLAMKEFKALGDLSFYRYLNVYDSKGVNNIKNILNFELRNFYNAGDYGTQVLFWDGSDIHHVRDIRNTDDPPCYYTEHLIYPNDKDGVKNYILIKSQNGCNERDQQIVEKTNRYIWKNNRLQAIPKSKKF